MLIIPTTFATQAHVIPPLAGILGRRTQFLFEDMTGPFENDTALSLAERVEIDLVD
jgi:hypothetical protein